MDRTPWHIWAVGGLGLLWNAIGAWDWVASRIIRPQAYLDMMTPEQLAFFDAIPGWAVAAWAVAVFGSVLGSVLILMRRALAVPVLWISFLAMGLTAVQNFLLSEASMADLMGPAAVAFSGAIVIVGLLLIWYAVAQRNAGRLT